MKARNCINCIYSQVVYSNQLHALVNVCSIEGNDGQYRGVCHRDLHERKKSGLAASYVKKGRKGNA